MGNHKTNKSPLTAWLDKANRRAVHQLASKKGYKSTSEFQRAILSQLCDENNIAWDYDADPISQWGEYNKSD